MSTLTCTWCTEPAIARLPVRYLGTLRSCVEHAPCLDGIHDGTSRPIQYLTPTQGALFTNREKVAPSTI